MQLYFQTHVGSQDRFFKAWSVPEALEYAKQLFGGDYALACSDPSQLPVKVYAKCGSKLIHVASVITG